MLDPAAVPAAGREAADMAYTALVVEDHETNRQLMCRWLEKRGFRVLARPTAAEALSVLDRQQPDIILLDLSLPDMDGWTLARRLKACEATRAIPLIAVTARAMPGDRAKALQAGCDEYVSKPINFSLLLATMDQLLRSETH